MLMTKAPDHLYGPALHPKKQVIQLLSALRKRPNNSVPIRDVGLQGFRLCCFVGNENDFLRIRSATTKKATEKNE